MNTIIAMLQSLILNITYTNEQLQRFACLSAIMVQTEVPFPQVYTVNINLLSITPDADNDFALFVAMHAALLIVKNEIRAASTESIRISDGPSSLDTTSYVKALMEYYKILANDYDKAKLDLIRSGKIGAIGFTVVTPVNIDSDLNPISFSDSTGEIRSVDGGSA